MTQQTLRITANDLAMPSTWFDVLQVVAKLKAEGAQLVRLEFPASGGVDVSCRHLTRLAKVAWWLGKPTGLWDD